MSGQSSPLPAAGALLEMADAAQTVADLRDDEDPGERVICPTKGETL